MNSFRDLMQRWPSLGQLARETDQSYEVVKKWHQRDSIPADHWITVVEAAGRRGILISVHDLALLIRQKREAA